MAKGEGMPQFERYIGIDYSGAETPTSSLKGLRVYQAGIGESAREVPPPPSPRKYWTRHGIAMWLAEQLTTDVPTIVGIDHGFSFPVSYFEAHGLPQNWDAFLEDFVAHWPTHENISVESVRNGLAGQGTLRQGSARWRRLCEMRARAKSVFHFDVQGSVAKSTHAGIPWLLSLRRHVRKLHFWPFDGWRVLPGQSVVLEAYPALYKSNYVSEDRTPDQHDAFSISSWLRDADADGRLQEALQPNFAPDLLVQARIEGWILGVM